uniref:Uncharacterized protein n=1 Tax=Anopheles darlingi TaxID=43151 RepID=A0A2M4D3A3_ANODA
MLLAHLTLHIPYFLFLLGHLACHLAHHTLLLFQNFVRLLLASFDRAQFLLLADEIILQTAGLLFIVIQTEQLIVDLLLGVFLLQASVPICLLFLQLRFLTLRCNTFLLLVRELRFLFSCLHLVAQPIIIILQQSRTTNLLE